MKKYLLALSALLLMNCTFTQTTCDMQDYVLATLIQVFDPMAGGEGYNDLYALKRYDRKNHDHVTQDIEYIKRNILYTIRYASFWKLLTQWSSHIEEEAIQQILMNEIEKFVDQRSFETAIRKTKNPTIAAKVAKTIRDDLQKKYLAASFLSHGIFRNFIGKKLEQSALACCKLFAETHQTINHHDLYPSEDCCVCYDSFHAVDRIFLMPCGHDICPDCAREWFFDQRKNTCPQCRATVDMHDLRLALQYQRPPAYNPEWLHSQR